MGENNSKWSNWQTTNLKNIQATPAAQFQKNKRPIKKWAKELNRQFSKEDIEKANTYMKRCSTSLITSEIGVKGTFLYCWWECKLLQPLWRTMWRFLKKLEIELAYDSAIPLMGIHTEETRTERHTCIPMFTAALFVIAWTWKQRRCPSADEWIRKPWYIYTMEYYSAIKRIHLN